MPEFTNYALALGAQYYVRYTRSTQDFAEMKARWAEFRAFQAARKAIRRRQRADLARTENDRAELDSVRAQPVLRRAEEARKAPDEAGRYFRAAMEDLVFARHALVEALEQRHKSTRRVEELTQRATDADVQAQDFHSRSINPEREAQLTEVAEDSRQEAGVWFHLVEIAKKITEEHSQLSVKAAHTLVAVSTVNSENPPYLSQAENEVHQRILTAARNFIALETVENPLQIIMGEATGSSLEMSRAGNELTNLCMLNLERLPYPQGRPGYARNLDELDAFLLGLPHPKISDLDRDNRHCDICREPYETDASQAEVADGGAIDHAKPEIPLALPCGHILGSICLETWLTPQRNNFCPFCTQKVF